MEVEITFVLQLKKNMQKDELEKYLDENCPIEIKEKDKELFEVSSEHWEVI